jgi:uncharacterized phage-associated protein
MTISAAAVANEFLSLQAQDSSGNYPPIDHMKLQKLVFYAHAWHLAIKDTPLFDDDVEAWPWGPVIRNIYVDFHHFGRNPIVGKKATRIVKTQGNGNLNFAFETPEITDTAVKQFLKDVWNVHKKFTGVQLSNATHAPGEPWTIVKENYGSLSAKPKIENELIRDIFKAKRSATNAS